MAENHRCVTCGSDRGFFGFGPPGDAYPDAQQMIWFCTAHKPGMHLKPTEAWAEAQRLRDLANA